MPPKKKKTAVSPIVVGTVSTRSTRRQSVVNIDIPKSNKSSAKKSPTTETTREQEISSADSFSEKIKQTYNKMFSKIFETNKIINKSSTSITSNYGSPELKSDSTLSIHTNTKSNEALLQILEDWTDDESQEDKKVSSHAENENSFSGIQELPRTIKNEQPQTTAEVVLSAVTKHSPNQDEPPVVIQTYRVNQEIVKMETEPISKTDDMEAEELQYILEDEASVPIEEHVEEIVSFEEENVVECVTEEVVYDNDEQFLLMDTAEEDPATTFEVNREETSLPQETNKNDPTVTVLPPIKTPEDRPIENKDLGTNNATIEETSQSVSTSDSNDAEVRSFFTKEIENNKNVAEEDVPVLKYEPENEGVTESVNSVHEEKVEIAVNGSEEVSKEFVMDQEDEDTNVEVNECELNKSDTQSEKLLTEESKTEESPAIEDKIIGKETAEPMDTVDEINEETIESKVAQMHLVDDPEKEEASGESSKLGNQSHNLNYSLRANIEEVIGVKAGCTYSTDSIKMEDEEDDIELSVERPKTRRTRSVEIKVTPKETEEQKDEKSKTAKAKERKPPKPKDKTKESKSVREAKSKKKPSAPPRRSKEKCDKTVKTEKKEISKKIVDQLKKSSKSDTTDTEDTEVRRSSRIKSISVLKKKTTGHGLVRSKSEPVLNESDVSDSNSTYTESEKSTPSASPKVSLKDKKVSRWTRSSENLSCDSQSATDSLVNKSDTHLSEVTSMEIDEKPKLPIKDPVVTARLKQFVHLKENLYKTDRMTCKEAKKMTCDCFLTTEEIDANEFGCGEDCLNRLLLIEWFVTLIHI